MTGGRMIALLGRRDLPTDALEEYCFWLRRALAKADVHLEPVRVPWAEIGWLRSLGRVWRQSAQWRDDWALMNYTALSWARRGFPAGFLVLLCLLRLRQVRVAVIFHDPQGYPGQRLIDRLRRIFQLALMRLTYRWANRSILTVPVEHVSWLPENPTKAAFVPVGSNIPKPTEARRTFGWCSDPSDGKTVVVFGVTGGDKTQREVADIAHVVRQAAKEVPGLRLVVVGRGSEEARGAFEQALNGAGVELSVLGLLPPEEVTQVLAAADALLFVRGHLSSRRGSGVAGIACGLPIVGYAGVETGFPVVEAGVALAPQGDCEVLARALTRVLNEEQVWRTLHRRSLSAERKYFSWERIADRFLELLPRKPRKTRSGGSHFQSATN